MWKEARGCERRNEDLGWGIGMGGGEGCGRRGRSEEGGYGGGCDMREEDVRRGGECGRRGRV